MTSPPDLPEQTPPKPPVVASQRRGILSWLALPFRLIGYVSLLVVLVGFTVAFGLPALDLCQSNGPGIACDSETLQPIADFGLTILYLSVFTGIPLLLACWIRYCFLRIGRWAMVTQTP